MRVPFTYTYLQGFIARLRHAGLPGVTIPEIGTTPEGRQLQVIRLDDPAPTQSVGEQHAMLVIAREHATEPAGSWVVQGLLTFLIGDTPDARAARKNTTWFLLPYRRP